MLTIRQPQLSIFAETERRKFEEWMLLHIAKFFPNATAGWGEPQLIEFIRHGIRRAKANGIRSRRAVCKYIDLMIVLGRDFDTDPKYPWAARALRDWHSESGKIEALFRNGLREEAKLRNPRLNSVPPGPRP